MIARLQKPPIVEVICGFIFQPIQGLDPMMIGRYWAEITRKNFPKKQLQPAISDLGIPVFPGPASRCWMLSSDEAFLIQIQHDRFYFNWRKRGESAYPHCSDSSDSPGILSRSINEYEAFAAFVGVELQTTPAIVRLELAKIDLLVQSTHWQTESALSHLLPLLAPVQKIVHEPKINMLVHGQRDDHGVVLSLQNAFAPDMSFGIQMETRVMSPPPQKPHNEMFGVMNRIANEVFAETIPHAVELFEGKEDGHGGGR